MRVVLNHMASKPRIQGPPLRAASRPRSGLQALAILLALGAAVDVAAGELCRFEVGDLAVSAQDVSADGGLGVEIAVADGPLILTRVAIPAPAGAAGCWHTELDAGRSFQIVVGLVEDGGRQPPRLVRFVWNGRLLDPQSLPDLDPTFGAGYAGGDSLTLSAGMLIRSFAVRSGAEDSLTTRYFRYAPDRNRWVRLRALARTDR